MPHNMYIGARNTTRLLFKTAVSAVFTCIGALGTPPAERGPSLESIYRVSLTVTVDLCEG